MAEAWKQPPVIKLYEALGSLGDGRVKLEGDNATVDSSTGNKRYTVTYDASAKAIMSNDNGSYWQGYLGYPAIAVLLKRGVLTNWDRRLCEYLKGFAWKEINASFKNDWSKTEALVKREMKARYPELDLGWFDHEIGKVYDDIAALRLTRLGPRTRPPAGN